MPTISSGIWKFSSSLVCLSLGRAFVCHPPLAGTYTGVGSNVGAGGRLVEDHVRGHTLQKRLRGMIDTTDIVLVAFAGPQDVPSHRGRLA